MYLVIPTVYHSFLLWCFRILNPGYTKRIITKLDISPESFLFAFDEKLDIIGYAQLSIEDKQLDYIATSSKVRRLGVGTMLMQHVATKAPELGFTTLKWSYRANVSSTANFYERFLTDNAIAHRKTQIGFYLNGDTKMQVTMDLPLQVSDVTLLQAE